MSLESGSILACVLPLLFVDWLLDPFSGPYWCRQYNLTTAGTLGCGTVLAPSPGRRLMAKIVFAAPACLRSPMR